MEVARGRPRGGAFSRCEGHLSSGAPPPLAARPQGGLSGSAAHVLWARVCGRVGPALSLWLACPAGSWVLRGSWEAVPEGVAFHRYEGRLVSGSVPPPAARPLGRAAEFCDACFSGAVGVGFGTKHHPHSVRSCEPSLRGVGVAEGHPRGGCLAPLCGASEFRPSPFSGCPSSGRAVGVRYPSPVGPGVRAWGPSTLPLAYMPCGQLRAAGVSEGCPGRGALPPM